MRELLPRDLKVDFISLRWHAGVLSLVLIAASVFIWFWRGDAKYGVDYKGGHEVVVKIEGSVSSDAIRRSLEKGGIDNFSVQSFEAASGQYSIRYGAADQDSKVIVEKVKSALEAAFSGRVQVLATNFIGPTVGKELRRQAYIAIILGLIGMLLYISYRFEMAFAVGVVAALFHDVIISLGVYLFVGHEINMATLAACLTIVGYSANDTIVIFDRVREELFKRKEFDLPELFNECLNATLSRTIVVSLLTFFSALALWLWGGGAIQDLSLLLVVGIIVGSYSTIYIASPVVLLWENLRTPAGGEAEA